MDVRVTSVAMTIENQQSEAETAVVEGVSQAAEVEVGAPKAADTAQATKPKRVRAPKPKPTEAERERVEAVAAPKPRKIAAKPRKAKKEDRPVRKAHPARKARVAKKDSNTLPCLVRLNPDAMKLLRQLKRKHDDLTYGALVAKGLSKLH